MVGACAAGENDGPHRHVQKHGRDHDVYDAEKDEGSSDPRRQQSMLLSSAEESGITSLNGWGRGYGDGSDNDDDEKEEPGDAGASNAASDVSSEWAPCSILQWEPCDEQNVDCIPGEDDDNIRAATSDSRDNGTQRWRCESTKLSTPQGLQDYLSTGIDRDKPRTEDTKDKANASILLSRPPRPASHQPTSLLTINKLQPDLLAVLLASPQGLDLEFLEIHAGLRRPPVLRSSLSSNRRRLSSCAIIATWTYPEIVTEMTSAPNRPLRNTSLCPPPTARDAFRCPEQDIQLYKLNDTQHPLWAAFSHATLRVGGQVKVDGGKYQRMADVLLADSRFQGHIQDEHYLRSARGHPFVSANRDRINVTQYEASDEENHAGTNEVLLSRRIGGGGKYPSFAKTLRESWEDATDFSVSADETAIVRMLAVEETAYELWLDLFDVVQPQQLQQRSIASKRDETPSLAWHAMEALERNQAMSIALRRIARAHKRQTVVMVDRDSISGPDWAALIRRLEMRVALLPVQSLASFAPPPPVTHVAPRVRASSLKIDDAVEEDDINDTTAQRALDRITYLGGILLPMSIVASILSMNDDFAPGSDLFWIFWVVAVPLTLGTVGFIYADKLRRVMVWQEVDEQYQHVAADFPVIPGEVERNTALSRLSNSYNQPIAMSPAQVSLASRRESWSLARPAESFTAGGSAGSAGSPSQQDFVVDLGDKVEEIHVGVRIPQRRQRHGSFPAVNQHPAMYERPGARPGGLRRKHDNNSDADGPSQRPHRRRAWKKKELGWGGAAICMLRMQNPQQAAGGLPSEVIA